MIHDELIRTAVSEIEPADRQDAKGFHQAFMWRMAKRGIKYQREYTVPGGRIDVVIWLDDGTTCAVELDNKCARQKSLKKVSEYGGGYVILRNPRDGVEIIKV